MKKADTWGNSALGDWKQRAHGESRLGVPQKHSEGSVAEQTDQVETEGRGETGRAGKGGQAAGPQAPAHALASL